MFRRGAYKCVSLCSFAFGWGAGLSDGCEPRQQSAVTFVAKSRGSTFDIYPPQQLLRHPRPRLQHAVTGTARNHRGENGFGQHGYIVGNVISVYDLRAPAVLRYRRGPSVSLFPSRRTIDYDIRAHAGAVSYVILVRCMYVSSDGVNSFGFETASAVSS